MAIIALAAVLTVTLPLGECTLDNAVITFVPPNTMDVVMLSQCGGMKCWDRWIDSDGKRIGATRACSENNGNGESFVSPPSPAAQP